MGEDETGPERLSAEHFRGWVGKPIGFAGVRARLVLDDIEAAPGAGGDRTPFTLVFSGDRVLPPDPGFLPEGLYACGPDGEPTRTLYVSPIQSRRADRQEYQAVFA